AHIDATDGKEVAARIAVEIHAGAMLLVHYIVQRHADAANGVARRIEHFRAEPEQAAKAATRDGAGDIDGTYARLHRQSLARRIVRIGSRHHASRIVAHHQRLTVADEYVHLVVVGGDDADVHMLRQFIQQAIALV